MGGRAKDRHSSEPEPRQVRDALKQALQAAYGGRLRTAFEALGIHGNWGDWGKGFPSATSLRHLAPDLARVGVSLDDVLLRPHVVPWRLAVEGLRPGVRASWGEIGLWLRIQDAITRRRPGTRAPNQGGQICIRLEARSAEARALTEHPAQDNAIATARSERAKRRSTTQGVIQLRAAVGRIEQKLKRSRPPIVFRVTDPGGQKKSFELFEY